MPEPQRAPLPTLDLPIRIQRDQERLLCDGGEICVGPLGLADRAPRVVQFRVDGTLLADEMIVIVGRPLDWTGPTSRLVEDLPLIEDVFPEPFVLNRGREIVCSGLPRLRELPAGCDLAGWSFLSLLLRGDDTPWITRSVLRLRQARPR